MAVCKVSVQAVAPVASLASRPVGPAPTLHFNSCSMEVDNPWFHRKRWTPSSCITPQDLVPCRSPPPRPGSLRPSKAPGGQNGASHADSAVQDLTLSLRTPAPVWARVPCDLVYGAHALDSVAAPSESSSRPGRLGSSLVQIAPSGSVVARTSPGRRMCRTRCSLVESLGDFPLLQQL